MDIRQSKNINTGNLDTQGGNVHLGDNFYKSLEYKEMTERIEEMRDFMQSTTDEVKRLKYSQKLNELQNQLEAFKRDIIQLAETFQKIDIDTKRLRLAKQHFDNGEYKAARAVLDAEQMTGELDALLAEKERLSEKTTKNTEYLKDKANEFLILAELTAADYDLGIERFEMAKEYFEQSLQADRNISNIFYFAFYLQNNNWILEATPLYEEALAILRKLSREDSETYLLDLGVTLNNLANLYRDRNEFEQAESAYEEALAIKRQLAKVNPKTYLSHLGDSLNNLANLQKDKNELEQARRNYREALDIYIQLAEINLQIYLPHIANTLNNLGLLLNSKKEYNQAERVHIEALNINVKLAKENPLIHSYSLGLTYINLGLLYYNKNDFIKAELFYNSALEIYLVLSKNNPQIYAHHMGTILNNLGLLYCEKNEFAEAERAYQAALGVRKNLVKLVPQTHLPKLAETMVNMSLFYLQSYPQKEKSVKLAIETIKIVSQFEHVPIVAEYREIAVYVLQKWNIDIESLFDEDDESPK